MLKLLVFFFSLPSFALVEAVILSTQGEASFNNRPLITGEKILNHGRLKTGAGAFVKVFIPAEKLLITLSSNSILALTNDAEKEIMPQVLQGVARFTYSKESKGENLTVKTRNLIITVQGTDFIALYNPLLHESEVISLTGSLLVRSVLKEADQIKLLNSQWVGLGGRFGNQVSGKLDLDERVLSYYDQKFMKKTFLYQTRPKYDYYGQEVPSK